MVDAKVKCARPVHGISISFYECTGTHVNCAVILLICKFITLTVHNFICRKHTLQALGSRPSPLYGASWLTHQTFYTHGPILSSAAAPALTRCMMAEFPSAYVGRGGGGRRRRRSRRRISRCLYMHFCFFNYATDCNHAKISETNVTSPGILDAVYTSLMPKVICKYIMRSVMPRAPNVT